MCETSYSDRGGKYQGQSGVTLAEDLAMAKKVPKVLTCGVKSLYARAVFFFWILALQRSVKEVIMTSKRNSRPAPTKSSC